MNLGDLPDEDNVLRHVRYSQKQGEDGADGSAFRLAPDEEGLSVNWIEFFPNTGKSQAIANIREQIQRRLGGQSIFAELNIDDVKQCLRQNGWQVSVVHSPQEARGDFGPDPSHSEIRGLPPRETPDSKLVGDLIADCINNTYPARED